MSDDETDIDESLHTTPASPQEEVSAISVECEMETQEQNECSADALTDLPTPTASSSLKEASSSAPPDRNDNASVSNLNVASPEIYFLIWKFLTASPCSTAAKYLACEINQMNLLPKRLDWQGNYHDHSLESYSRLFSHVKADHLLKLAANEVNPFASWSVVPTNRSLLGSFLPENQRRNKSPSLRVLTAHVAGRQVIQSPATHLNSNYPLALSSQSYQGPIGFSNYISSHFYSKCILHRRLLGHLSAVYCVCFDRTGKYIISGADDLLVKIWSAKDGRLISTLRGHSAEIADISVSHENTLVATGSIDKHIRIWCLRTTAPICVLTNHQQQVTTVKFCPLLIKGETRYLVSTSQDGSICFWNVNVNTNYVDPKPLKFIERPKPGASIISSSFSSGGAFLACGSTDHYIRVFHVSAPHGPVKILEIEAHTDYVDSLVFSNRSLRFVSGSKDGHAHIWYYERQTWKNLTLDMYERALPLPPDNNNKNNTIKVNMIAWSCDDKYVITSSSDRSIRAWNSITGELIHVMKGHEDDAFVIEPHPTDSRIVVTAGHDGKAIVWDIHRGAIIKSFINTIEGQVKGLILDLKISPDGTTFAATDSHAHVLIFGFGSSSQYEKVPSQVFFHTDYRPLVRDVNNYVIDEQTQCPPHLMPPPFLVDIDGNPHPPIYQRLVPGRENCNEEQLVPHIAVHNERGVNEILQPANENVNVNQLNVNNNGPFVQANQARQSALDAMIESLANRLDRPGPGARANVPNSQPPEPQASSSNASSVSPQASSSSSSASSSSSSSSSIVNLPPANADNRRNRNSNRHRHEGVRSTGGNWQTIGGFIGNSSIWSRDRPAVRPLPLSELNAFTRQTNQLAQAEEEHYFRETKKRPLVLPPVSPRALVNPKEKFTRRKKRLNEQRQGLTIAYQSNHARNSNAATVRRHMAGIVDEQQDDNELSDQSSHATQSGAESWNDDSQSESSEESSDDSSDASTSESDDESGSDGDYNLNRGSARRSSRLRGPTCQSSHKSWQKLCKQMIDDLCRVREFAPFRIPVDQMEYPDYARVIDTPMDLNSLKEQLAAGEYETMNQFKHDLFLIFKNSRQYNTEKSSQIYKWTTKFQESVLNHLSDIQKALRSQSRVRPQTSRRSADRSSDRRSSSRTEGTSRGDGKKKKVQSKKGKAIKRDTALKNTSGSSSGKGKRIVKRPTPSKSHSSTVTDIDVKPGPSGLGEGSSSSCGQSKRTVFLKSLVASDDDDDDTMDALYIPGNSETEIEDNVDYHVTDFDSDATELAEPVISPSLSHDVDTSLDAAIKSNSTGTDYQSSECTRDSPIVRQRRKSGKRTSGKRKKAVKNTANKRRRVKVEIDDEETDIDDAALLNDENTMMNDINTDTVVNTQPEQQVQQQSPPQLNGAVDVKPVNLPDAAADSGSNGSLGDHDYASHVQQPSPAGPRTRGGGIPRVKYSETVNDDDDDYNDGFTEEELANSSEYAFPATGLTNNGKTTSRSGRQLKLKPFVRTMC